MTMQQKEATKTHLDVFTAKSTTPYHLNATFVTLSDIQNILWTESICLDKLGLIVSHTKE